MTNFRTPELSYNPLVGLRGAHGIGNHRAEVHKAYGLVPFRDGEVLYGDDVRYSQPEYAEYHTVQEVHPRAVALRRDNPAVFDSKIGNDGV